jgi:nucleotide-binding universal stress UspA family protein
MLKRILVPLDGSDFGEQALPMALRIAERDHAALELVHVYEYLAPFNTQGAPPLDPTLDQDLKKDREAYLDSVAEWLRLSTNLPVTATVLEGEVAPTLVRYIATRHADLVVMATHGRGGLSRLWLGSVASELMRHSLAPVMLIRPTETGSRSDPARPLKLVLVPLDGSPAAEEAIDHALSVAHDKGTEFLLYHVVLPVVYIAEPPDVAFVHETEMESAAQTYLREVAGRIRARGFSVDTRVDIHTSPARAILECVEGIGADLIAMETHGHSGLERVLLGTVADKVTRASPVPVLVHRPGVEATQTAGRQRGERTSESRRS